MIEAQTPSDVPSIQLCTCTRCGFRWFPRNQDKPRTCANQKCRSPYWDKPRRQKKIKT